MRDLTTILSLLYILIGFIGFQSAYADDKALPFKAVEVEGAHERVLKSKIIDQEYKLLINLPRSYQSSNKDYAVIYLLDAQWDFTTLVSLYGQLHYDGDIPELIIVGVTWGGEKPNPGMLRGRDFSPSRIEAYPDSGGAEQFLEFFKTELIPFVDKEYRSNQQRILMGGSLGGLFATYVMFTETALFNAYLPTGIAAKWDNEVILEYAKKFVKRPIIDTETKMYSSVGENDSLLPSINRLHAYLGQEKPSGLDIKFEIFPNLGHAAIKSIGYLRGLQYLYAKNEISLTIKQLQPFAGIYEGDDGVKVTVDIDNDRLMVTNHSGSRDHFRAMSNNEFFLKGVYTTISFDTREIPTKMKVVLYEGELELVKVD